MIYFIQNTMTKVIKIGISCDPQKRLAALQTANHDRLEILGTIPGGSVEEAKLHRRFADRRLVGEWFRGDPGMVQAVKELVLGPLKLHGEAVRRVYLAGKITDDPWRDDFFGSNKPRRDYCVDNAGDDWYSASAVTVPDDSRRLDYVGPFWLDIYGGHGSNPGAHAFGKDFDHCSISMSNPDTVRTKCLGGIARADLMFAWIDQRDCFGTLAEISWAYARRFTHHSVFPFITIACSPESLGILNEMWFVAGMADFVISAGSPVDAWSALWASGNAGNDHGRFLAPIGNVIRSLAEPSLGLSP